MCAVASSIRSAPVSTPKSRARRKSADPTPCRRAAADTYRSFRIQIRPIDTEEKHGYNCVNPTGVPASSATISWFTLREERTATVLAYTEFGQYTSVLVNGDGTRTASFETSEQEVRAGDPVGLGGSGFRPGADVTVSWADGRGDSITVKADDSGSFLALLPTRVNETTGLRTLVATSGDQLARAEVEVLRNPRVTARQHTD